MWDEYDWIGVKTTIQSQNWYLALRKSCIENSVNDDRVKTNHNFALKIETNYYIYGIISKTKESQYMQSNLEGSQ